MSYAAQLNIVNLGEKRMISCNGVKIQESENIVPFNFVNESLPASNQRIDNFHVNNFVLNDLD
jgi:hypothetical protein